ncbi:hypothetical protein VB713_03100 [Anabaena cylindrica UHCC 0172]|uniref:hypothetical protein n=1 Tax=Anabaena cylindrica TaxID=1165 RepID=UPI002B1FC718|nr:hypothetical protein [Anabaena cylindrica]MEA5549977.1 hypothetical protein [Anabaena cylindrica UHCC 0172]
MDEVVRKVAALGLPGVLLVVTMATTGLVGAAAITTALATLGGPFGMLGGIGLLGIAALVSDALGKYGIEAILIAVYNERRKQESIEKLCREIDGLAISSDLKRKLKEIVSGN